MFFSASSSPPGRPGKTAIIMLMVFLCSFLGATSSASEQQACASRVKAAFLYNFAKFVEWPPEAFGSKQGIITFCILAQDPMAAAVEALQGKVVQGRKIVVKRCQSVEEMTECQVFFGSGANKLKLAKIISVLRKFPILTVTDEVNDFATLGVVINLTIVGDKVRFYIAANNAGKCGLRISSQLLKLALRLN